MFDHRETRCTAATLGYGAFGGKIVYDLRWMGGETIFFQGTCVFFKLTYRYNLI